MLTTTKDPLADLRRQLAGSGVDQGLVAVAMGIHESTLSKILNGKRPVPADFSERLEAGIREAARQEAQRLMAVAGGSAA
jgi:plasmid maintenance system antidote protein VapI